MVNVLSNRISPPHQLLTSPLHSVPCHTADHGSADGVNCDQNAKEGQTPVHHTDRAVPHLPHHCPQNVILTRRANSSLYSSKKVRIVHNILCSRSSDIVSVLCLCHPMIQFLQCCQRRSWWKEPILTKSVWMTTTNLWHQNGAFLVKSLSWESMHIIRHVSNV